MLIVLPYERYGLPDVFESLSQYLSNTNARNLTSSELKPTMVEVKLPAFEFGQQIDLIKVFEKLGVDLKSALTGLDPQLQINKAIHEARIKTDNVGTEAAAVTITATVILSAIRHPKADVVFTVDHPFAFIIRDNISGLHLFTGVVNKLN
ncbi:hypothetical protein B4U80_11686 [Leptotrombidium deliense]|uniref:Serpin domain-containing protein n=1 Tax=Leptotrombidium deliense TaxID=299467 RepID=A0A443S3X1_9ACAR|nr:hypothetical protein B4U80_11686 [Leptotrombidium deliense]